MKRSRVRAIRLNRTKYLPWLSLIALAFVVIALLWWLKGLGVDVGYLNPARVREYVLSFGLLAPIMYLAIYSQPLVPLPTTIMMATGGLAFGPLWGLVAAMSGATMRGCSQFLVARFFGRGAVRALLCGRTARLNRSIRRNSFKTVLFVRLIPNVPYDMQNYALGCSRVHFGPYVLATFLGIIPGCIAFVYLGYSLTDLAQLWKLILAIILIGGLVWVRRSRKVPWRARRAALAEEPIQVISSPPHAR